MGWTNIVFNDFDIFITVRPHLLMPNSQCMHKLKEYCEAVEVLKSSYVPIKITYFVSNCRRIPTASTP